MKILSSAPSRISLFGGGTDVSPYIDSYGSEVLSFAINIRQHIMLYTDDDIWEKTSHNIPLDADPALLYEILSHFKINGVKHVRVNSSFDGIIGAGLGSSASFTVALIGAIVKYKNLILSREDIAKLAYKIEVLNLNWFGGRQDQLAACLGGLNHMEFVSDKTTIISLQRKYAEQLTSWMILCYLGGKRKSRIIQKGLTELTEKKRNALHNIKKMVPYVTACLLSEDYSELGSMIHESWEYKKESNNVSTSEIDDLYDYALKHGAAGGKLCGAGGGGYFLYIVPPEKRKYFLEKMGERGIEETDFSPDFNGVEVRIL